MAEGYETDDEQVEALKKWWNENGTSTLVTIVLVIVCVFGWQGWQKQKQESINTASEIYQNMLGAANGADGNPGKEQRATANHLATTLKQDFPDSTYAQFAALYKAKLAVEDKKLDEAVQELKWVLESGAISDIILETRLRLARVYYSQDKYTEALEQLKGDVSVYGAAYEEVKGDVFNAQGEQDKAKLAYLKASELNQQAENPANNPLLNLKIQQLNSKLNAATAAISTDKEDS